MPRAPEYDRNELIDRARDLFWRKGWAGTSMKDLQRALGLNPGSFYGAFGSKDALFELTIDRYVAAGREQLRALRADYGPLDVLARYPMSILNNADAPARACMLAKTVLELQPQGHALAEKANRHLTDMEDQFAALFAEAQAMGTIGSHHDPRRLARRYQSDLLGLRLSAERDGVDGIPIAEEIADGLRRLQAAEAAQSQ